MQAVACTHTGALTLDWRLTLMLAHPLSSPRAHWWWGSSHCCGKDLAVKPSAMSSVFLRQLTELATSCCSSLSADACLDWRPELHAPFGNRLIWQTDSAVLMSRVEKHLECHKLRPPSYSADKDTMTKVSE